MSATASTPSAPASTGIPAYAIPIIEAYARGIKPPVAFIMIGTVFSSMLIPLLMALIYFSTSHSWRQPIFILNVLAIVLGLVVGTMSTDLMIQTILSPLTGVNSTEDFVHNVLYIWESWISEAVLVLRVLVVIKSYRTAQKAALLAFPVVIKAVRAAVTIVFLHRWRLKTMHAAVNIVSITKLSGSWPVKTGWILEIFDNGYISALFLLQLGREGHIFNGASIGRVSNESKGSIFSRMKWLFWIASTNFIFPVVFNVAQVILLFTAKDILMAAYVQMVNVYVCIIATVLATVGSSTAFFNERLEHSDRPSEKNSPPGNPNARRREYQSHISFARGSTNTHASTSDEEDPVVDRRRWRDLDGPRFG